MAAAAGNVTGLNLATFIKNSPGTYANVLAPTTTELGTKAGSEAATKLVAKANFMPDITNLANLSSQASEASYFPFYATQSKQIPGIPETQNWSFTFALVYPGGTEAQAKADIFGVWMDAAVGDYIEIAVIEATGNRGTAQAITGLFHTQLSLLFFRGNIASKDEFLGGAAAQSNLTIDVSLLSPAYRIFDATS